MKPFKGCKPGIILPSIRNAPHVRMGRPPTGQRPDLCEPRPAAWVNRKKKQHALKGQTTLPPGASSKAMSDSVMRVDAKAAWDAPSGLLYILGLFPRALPWAFSLCAVGAVGKIPAPWHGKTVCINPNTHLRSSARDLFSPRPKTVNAPHPPPPPPEFHARIPSRPRIGSWACALLVAKRPGPS